MTINQVGTAAEALAFTFICHKFLLLLFIFKPFEKWNVRVPKYGKKPVLS